MNRGYGPKRLRWILLWTFHWTAKPGSSNSCQRVLSARHERDLKRLGKELRLAIREHIHIAKESLASHGKTFPIVDVIVSDDLFTLPSLEIRSASLQFRV